VSLIEEMANHAKSLDETSTPEAPEKIKSILKEDVYNLLEAVFVSLSYSE